MPNIYQNKEPPRCSFCGKDLDQAHKLIAGPGVFICDECVEVCYEIIKEEPKQEPDKEHDQLMSEFANALDALNALNDLGDAIDTAIDQLPAQNTQKMESEV